MSHASYVVALITITVGSLVVWLVLTRVMPPTVVLSSRRAALLLSLFTFTMAVGVLYLIPWPTLLRALVAR